MPDSTHITEYLANERTFLAWVRTCIAIISLGFVVAKFGVWVRELSVRLDPSMPVQSTGMSMPIGIGMMALGGIIAVLAAWHHNLVNQAIERGEPYIGRRLVIAVTIVVVALAIIMIVYMMMTSEHM